MFLNVLQCFSMFSNSQPSSCFSRKTCRILKISSPRLVVISGSENKIILFLYNFTVKVTNINKQLGTWGNICRFVQLQWIYRTMLNSSYNLQQNILTHFRDSTSDRIIWYCLRLICLLFSKNQFLGFQNTRLNQLFADVMRLFGSCDS